MRKLIGVLLCLAGSILAQEPDRLIAIVQYNPSLRIISWTVWEGKYIKIGEDHKFVKHSESRYQIDLRKASMTTIDDKGQSIGKPRFFTKKEADNVLTLMLMLTKYTAASTVWWMEGKGCERSDRCTEEVDLARVGMERRDHTSVLTSQTDGRKGTNRSSSGGEVRRVRARRF